MFGSLASLLIRREFSPKIRKKLQIIISPYRKERADKAQIQLHFTSSFFSGIIMRLQKNKKEDARPRQAHPPIPNTCR